MFNLERIEKFLIAFLILTLILGFGVISLRRLRPSVPIKIISFNKEEYAQNTERLKEKININEADVNELMRLKGIGKTLAERIIDYRSNNGIFASPEEIKKVKGVGPALFEKIKDEISAE